MDKRPGCFGPYQHGGRWRLLIRDGGGGAAWHSYATRDLAERVKEQTQASYRNIGRTIDEAITAYETYLRDIRKLKAVSLIAMIGPMRTLHRGVVELGEVTPSKAKALYRAFAATRAPTTHRIRLSETKGLWRWLVEEGWVKASPFVAVKGEGKKHSGKRQLTIDEARLFDAHALEVAASGRPGAVAALCCLRLALRRGEVVKLEVRDLDDGGAVVRVRDGKTARSTRALAVEEPLRSLLLGVAKGKGRTERLFPHLPDWVWDEVQLLCEGAGVPRVGPHGLRGTFSTLSQVQSVAVRAVSDALGHVDTSMTRKHYTDRTATDAAERRRGLEVLSGGKRAAGSQSVPTAKKG